MPVQLELVTSRCHSGHRAGDEVRTRDLQLGRLPLYQLSYSRVSDTAKW